MLAVIIDLEDMRCDEYAFNYALKEKRRETKNIGSLEVIKEI